MTAQYHVSDALQDRHPYNISTGFKQLAVQDTAKLFGGFGEPSFKYNIESLANEEIAVAEKTKMLRHLLSQLANADFKVRAINYGLVASLTWLADRNLGSEVDELVCLAVRALTVIPAGAFSVYRNGGLSGVVTVLGGRLDQPADAAMLRAREAACEAVKQLTVGWHTKSLLLGEDVPEGMVQLAIEPLGTADVNDPLVKHERQQLGRRVVETLAHLLASYNAGIGVSLRLLLSTLEALANLSADAQGLDLCLMCGVLREVDELLKQLAELPGTWMADRAPTTLMAADVVFTAVTVVWNVCMDPVGKRQEEALMSLPYSLGKLLLPTLNFPLQHIRLKAAIAGAISAIFIYEDTKNAGVALLLSPEEAAAAGLDPLLRHDVAELLLRLLREGNEMMNRVRAGRLLAGEPLEKAETVQSHAEGVVKNSVQCMRLLAEMPSVRPRVVELIDGDRDICLQLFRGTLIEELMIAACGVSP